MLFQKENPTQFKQATAAAAAGAAGEGAGGGGNLDIEIKNDTGKPNFTKTIIVLCFFKKENPSQCKQATAAASAGAAGEEAGTAEGHWDIEAKKATGKLKHLNMQ